MNDVPTKNPARRSFTDEFKADAVQLVVQGNRPIAQVARERRAHPDPAAAPTPVDGVC